MSFKLLIKEASIWDGTGFSPPTDLLIEEGRIARIGQGISAPGAAAVRAEGCLVLPGPRRPPGPPGRARSRRAGERGIGTSRRGGRRIHPHPRHARHRTCHRYRAGRRAPAPKERRLCDATPRLCRAHQGASRPRASRTRGSQGGGRQSLWRCRALDDHGTLRRASTYAGMLEIPIFVDVSAPTLAADGMVHESDLSGWLGLPGIPAAAESVGVASLLIVGDASAAGCTCKGSAPPTRSASSGRPKRRGAP